MWFRDVIDHTDTEGQQSHSKDRHKAFYLQGCIWLWDRAFMFCSLWIPDTQNNTWHMARAHRCAGWMDGCTDRWMDGWTDGRMDGWKDGWMDGWTDG